MKDNCSMLLKHIKRHGTTKETGHRNMNDEFFKDPAPWCYVDRRNVVRDRSNIVMAKSVTKPFRTLWT